MYNFYEMIEANRSEIESVAAQVGIDFSQTSFIRESGRHKAHAFDKKDKRRVAFYVNPINQNGKEHHLITFCNLGQGGRSQTWTSFKWQQSTEQAANCKYHLTNGLLDPTAFAEGSFQDLFPHIQSDAQISFDGKTMSKKHVINCYLSQIESCDPGRKRLKLILHHVGKMLDEDFTLDAIADAVAPLVPKYHKRKIKKRLLEELVKRTLGRKKREAKRKRQAEKAKAEAEKKQRIHRKYMSDYEEAKDQDQDAKSSNYFEEKGISEALSSPDLRIMADQHGIFIAVPLFKDGTIVGFQRIYDDKKMLTPSVIDGQFNGSYYIVGKDDPNCSDDVIYIAEGLATAYSIYMATGNKVAVAISAHNLKAVAKAMKIKYSAAKIIIAADNDNDPKKQGNTGVFQALEAAFEVGTTLVVPKTINGVATDWNDVHKVYGLDGLLKEIELKGNRVPVPKSSLEYHLKKLPFAHSNQLKKIINKIALLSNVPFYTSREELIESIARMISFPFPKQKIAQYIENVIFYQKVQAKKISDIKKTMVDDHRKFATVPNEDGHATIPQEVVDLVAHVEDAIIIVRSPMGTSKTEVLMKQILDQVERGIYLAPRRSLIADAAKRLGLDHYENIEEIEALFCAKLACCINSIGKAKFAHILKNLDILCLDEAIQSLPQIVTLGTADAKKANFDALQNAINSAKKTLICDATANEFLIEQLRKLAPNKKIILVDVNNPKPNVLDINFSPDANNSRLAALDFVTRGETLLVTTDSKNEALRMEALISQAKPDAKILNIYREPSKDKAQEIENFFNDPNNACQEYDVVIYSPAITSGLSITIPHFQNHVGIFHGVVNPMDILQMLGRDRTAKKWYLSIDNKYYRLIKDRQSLERGLLKLANGISGFDGLNLSVKAYDLKTRENIIIKSLNIFALFGHNVNFVENPDEKAKAGLQTAIKEINQQIKEARYALIEEQPLISEGEYNYLNSHPMLTAEQSAKLDKFRITNQMASDVTNDAIAFYEDDGLSKLKLHDALNSVLNDNGKAVKQFDEKELSKQASLRFHAQAKGEVLAKILEILGVSPNSDFEGEFNHADCQKVIDYFNSDELRDAFNYLGLGQINKKQLPRCATSWVKRVLKKIGLTLGKRKVNGGRMVRFIDQASWTVVKNFLQARKDRGINAFKANIIDLAA